MPRKQMGHSLAFLKFKHILTQEVQLYWFCLTAFEYSERWWNSIPSGQIPRIIGDYPSDAGRPFSGINLRPSRYLGLKTSSAELIRGNAIVNICTAFETFLLYGFQRAIVTNPSIIEDSGMQFTAGELSEGIKTEDFSEWLAKNMVEKYIRGKSHAKMVEKIDSTILGGLSRGQSDLIARWNKIYLLRNALVHNGRRVSKELSEHWTSRFPNTDEAIVLDDGDVIKTHSIAYELAQCIDEQLIRTCIQWEDAKVLARIIYLINTSVSYG
ncbi:MAG: hypothetical protein AAF614_41750, partial [Chloroflexota bacterium]